MDAISVLRWFFVWIDTTIFSLVANVYNILLSLASLEIFSSQILYEFSTRIYVVIGLFMLFKLSMSLIKYIVSPEQFTDNQKGMGKVIQHVMIALVLITLVPFIFGQAMQLQRLVLNSDLLGRIILGVNINHGGNSQVVTATDKAAMGKELAFTAFSAFYSLDPAVLDQLSECNGDAQIFIPKKFSDANETCTKKVEGITSNKEFKASLYKTAYNGMSIGELTHDEILYAKLSTGTKKHVIKYDIFITTIAGGFLLYILLLFSIDVAVRSVKLGFLQLIAPIPIISYIDPTAAKDGTFSKWMKMCVSVYLGLFIKLAALYFAIYVIQVINTNWSTISGEVTTGLSGGETAVVKVFIMFAAFIFAKELPKMLENLFGIDLSGGSFKSGAGLLKGALGGAVGLGVGAAGGLAAGALYGKQEGKSFLGKVGRGFGHGLTGAVGGGARGLTGGMKSGKGLTSGANAIHATSMARNQRDDGGGLLAGMGSMMGLKDQKTKGELYAGQDSLLKSQQNQASAASFLNDMESHDGGRYKSQYDKAFDRSKGLYDANGDTVINTAKHSNYAEYRDSVYAEGGMPTVDDRVNNSAKARELEKTMLTEQQYNSYKDALIKERTEGVNIKKHEKTVRDAESTLDAQKKSFTPKK